MDSEFLAQIEAFLAKHQMAPSTFGAMIGDRHFVRQIRAGRRVWPETAAKIRAKMGEFEAQQQAA
jgi:hypothetical protein